MVTAPNITTESVPTHLVRQLLSRYRHELDVGVQGDDGFSDGGRRRRTGPHTEAEAAAAAAAALMEDDDYHFQTREINIIAKERELKKLLLLNLAINSLVPAQESQCWHTLTFIRATIRLYSKELSVEIRLDDTKPGCKIYTDGQFLFW